METRANHVLIGAFLLASIFAVLGFIAWKSDVTGSGDRQAYVVLLDGPVRGLSTASDVLFNGLRVGKVRALRIWPDDSRKVEAVLWVKPGTPVRTNSTASIVQTGLTALAAVQISPGTPDTALVPGTLEAPFPTIPADPGTRNANLLEAAPELVSNANAAFQRINTLLADNQDSIRNTVSGLEKFATALEASREDFTALVKNARNVSEDLKGELRTGLAQVRQLAETSNAAVARIDALIARNEAAFDKTLANTAAVSETLASKREDIAATISNVKQLSEQVQRVSAKLETTLDQASTMLNGSDNKALFTEVRQTVESFRDLAQKLDTSLTGADGLTNQAKRSLKEFNQFMREGSRAAGSADRTLDTITRNPQSLLFGGKKVPDYTPQ
jgi:phospholipid/cholesterol/gamma-HCH transport system substrate-binding protein